MSSKNKNLTSSEIEALSASIESLIEDIQRVRLANKFNKMTEVRLVDLQYTARLTLQDIKGRNTIDKHQLENDTVIPG